MSESPLRQQIAGVIHEYVCDDPYTGHDEFHLDPEHYGEPYYVAADKILALLNPSP